MAIPNDALRTEVEAAAFRRLIQHLQAHPEIQNIDLMLTADFCRNCLAKWFKAEAEARGLAIDYAEAQEIVYGMPYAEWKAKYQTQAPPEKLRALEERQKKSSHPT
ncbi:DUF1244 domain-containing protein [Methylothermus subterraneus]